MALLRLENLSGDTSLDWIGRAVSESVAASLAGAPRIYAIARRSIFAPDQALGPRSMLAPGVSAERAAALAAGANRLVYGQFAVVRGVLRVDLSVEDARSGKTVATYTETGSPQALPALALALARRIWPAAVSCGARSAEAMRHWAEGIDGGSPETTERAALAAIAADPDFGPPYLLLAQARLVRQDPAGAIRALEDAQARGNGIAPVSRARIALELAGLRGDPQARLAAVRALGQLTPADPVVWSVLAQMAVTRQEYRQALDLFRKAIAIQPSDPVLLNSAGYAAAYAGDLSAAMEILRRYQEERPGEANPIDSMGDANFYLGRLGEAESFYLEAQQKDPAFNNHGPLFKAAVARLMTGDVAGADALAKRYIEAREAAADPLAEFRKAEWSWLSGRRGAAVARLTGVAQGASQPHVHEIAVRAWAQLAIWKLSLGDRAGAAQAAAKAAENPTPASAGIAALARFITQPPAPASEWAVRAELAFPQPQLQVLKNLSRAYALLFAKDFAGAAPLLREMYGAWNPAAATPGLPVLLAWALVETGRTKDAAPLLRYNPIPESSGLSPFTSTYLPRLFYLRGMTGGQERRKHFEVFLRLSGPDALMWGEEDRARAAMK